MPQIWENTFASPVTVTAPFVEFGQWWQDVLNGQAVPGVDSGFQLQILSGTPNPTAYVENFTAQTGPDGAGPCLFQFVHGSPVDPDNQARSNWFFDQDLETHGAEWTQQSRIYMQPDLATVMVPTGGFTFQFRQLFEVKLGPVGQDPTFRFNFGLEQHVGTTGLTWGATVEWMSPQQTLWHVLSSGQSIPAGQWFDMEIAVKFDQTNGIFIPKINGVPVVGTWNGRTAPLPLPQCETRWKLAVLYTAVDRMNGSQWQAVDFLRLLVPSVESRATSRGRRLAGTASGAVLSSRSRGRPLTGTSTGRVLAATARGRRRSSDVLR